MVSITWPALVQAWSNAGAFSWYAGWNIVGWGSRSPLPSETKEKTLEELDAVFDVPLRSIMRYGIAQASYFGAISFCAEICSHQQSPARPTLSSIPGSSSQRRNITILLPGFNSISGVFILVVERLKDGNAVMSITNRLSIRSRRQCVYFFFTCTYEMSSHSLDLERYPSGPRCYSTYMRHRLLSSNVKQILRSKRKKKKMAIRLRNSLMGIQYDTNNK